MTMFIQGPPLYSPALNLVVPFLNFRGIDILKNDVTAILNQIFDLKFQTKRHFTMPPGSELQILANFPPTKFNNL